MEPRLIVEAVGNEFSFLDGGNTDLQLRMLVTVSNVDTGDPVTGLTDKNFRFTDIGIITAMGSGDFIVQVRERNWDPNDNAPSGVYDIALSMRFGFITGVTDVYFAKGKTYAIGIRVMTVPYDHVPGRPTPVGSRRGQTVVSFYNN